MSDHVWLYAEPWVSGCRSTAWYGTVEAELFLPDRQVTDRAEAWERAQKSLLDDLSGKARELGANAILSLEVSADPFAVHLYSEEAGLRLEAKGTAAQIEPLFYGVRP